MKTKPHIYLPLEILFREFSPKILFSYHACLNNYRIYFGTKTGIDKIIQTKKKNDKSGIYFSNQILNNSKFINNIKSKCQIFAVLDEELGPAVANLDYSIKNRVKNSRFINKYFVLNKKIKKLSIKRDAKFKNILEVTGWPKYDFYRTFNKNFYLDEIKEIKKKYGNFYLLSSNYGALSQKGLIKKIEKNHYLKKDKKSTSKDYQTFKKGIIDFKYLKNLLKNFINEHKKIKIIIRPHPSDEFHSDWDYFKKFKNIEVVYKYDIIPWILACKGLIHRGCSTSIDASILKKKVFYLKPNRKLLVSEKNLTYKISKKIINLNEIFLKFESPKNAINLIKKEIFFHNTSSCKRILDSFKKNRIKKEFPIRLNPLKNIFYYFRPFLGKIIRLTLYKLFYKKNNYTNNKIPVEINKKDILKKIKSLDKKNLISVKEISRGVFEIDKK